jgi:hypothetical protein
MLYKTSADHARLYKNNTFTVYVTLPNQIHQITYHMPSTSNEDSLNKLSNIFKAEGHSPVVDTVEKSVTITVPGIDNVPFVNTSGSTLKITGVTVAYK